MLPNGVEMSAVDANPISTEHIYFFEGNEWYYECPAPKVLTIYDIFMNYKGLSKYQTAYRYRHSSPLFTFLKENSV